MTVVQLKKTSSKRTSTMLRGPAYKRRKQREFLFGFAVATLIITGSALAAFNGGFSFQAGGLEMTLDASLSKGMRLSFVSI